MPKRCALAGVLGALVAGAAHAQPLPLELPLSVDPCVPVDVEAFRRQLAIELQSARQASDLARAQTSTRIELVCSGEQIKVAVTDTAMRRSWRRRVDLHGVPPRAHTRLLALSVAELLLASWLELRIEASPSPLPPEREPEGAPAPRSAPPAPPEAVADERDAAEATGPLSPAPAAPSSARETPASEPSPPPSAVPGAPSSARERNLQLGAAGELLAFPSALGPLFGAELHVSVPLTAAWVLRAAAQGSHGRMPGDLARLSAPIRATTASLALSLGWVEPLGALELSASVGARLGLFHLAGSDTEANAMPERALAPWVGPLVSPGLRLRLTDWLHATLDLEAGLLAVRVRALMGPEQRVVAELRGVWLLARLGLDMSL